MSSSRMLVMLVKSMLSMCDDSRAMGSNISSIVSLGLFSVAYND